MTRWQQQQTLEAREPGFNARERIAKLEALAALQDTLLRQAAQQFDALEQRLAVLEHRPPAPPPDTLHYVPIAVGAKCSGLSVRTLKRLIARGKIVGHALTVTGSKRRRWLVDVESVRRFESTAAR